MQVNKSMLRITILLISMVMMGPIFMSPVMGDIIGHFPQYAPSTVQLLMTFPNLIVVMISLFFGKLEVLFHKKFLCLFSTCCVALSALGLFLFHNSLPIMFLMAGILGVGVGIIVNVTVVLISLYYHGEEEASLMGLQSSVNTVGAMIMNLLGAMLAGIAWYYDFLSPMIIVPGIILCLFFIPAHKGERIATEKVSVPRAMFLYYAIALLFGILFNVLPTNMALLIQEKALGGVSFAGLATAVFEGGGILGGLLYPLLKIFLEDRLGALAYLNLGIGLLLLAFAGNSGIILLGAFWGGCSISILMPQFMFSISNRTEQNVTPTALAFLMSAVNGGSFLAPLVFARVPAVTVSSGFRMVAMFTLVIAAVLFVVLRGPAKANTK